MDFWDELDRDYLVKNISLKSNPYEVIDLLCEILEKIEIAEKSHIEKFLSEGDLRSASLCYEAMGAYQLLRNKITVDKEYNGTS